jgi:hypothetical protein
LLKKALFEGFFEVRGCHSGGTIPSSVNGFEDCGPFDGGLSMMIPGVLSAIFFPLLGLGGGKLMGSP